MNQTTIGARIRLARQAANMSQAALARHMGISMMALNGIELHGTDPRASRVAVASRVLHVSGDYLLHGIMPVPTPETTGLRAWLAHIGA